MKWLSKLDMFGVHITQTFDNEHPTYQSRLGGLATVIINLLSLTYASYIFIQRYNGTQQPSASTSNYITDYSKLEQGSSFLSISYLRYSKQVIDPFRSIENILIPILLKTDLNKVIVSQTNLLNDTSMTYNEFGARNINLDFSVEFILNNNTNLYQMKYDYYIVLIKCSKAFLLSNQTCASDEVINNFFEQPANQIIMDFNFRSIDASSFNTLSMKERILIGFEPTLCYVQGSYLKSTLYQVSDYLLFGKPKEVELIDNQVIQSSTQTMDYCKTAFLGQTTYIVTYIQYGNLQTLNKIQFETLGTLLANIGSIVSCLFLIKYLIIFLNDRKLNELILNQLILFYYPEMKLVKVTHDWKGKVKSVKFKDQDIQISKYINFIERAQSIMLSKLTFKNFIYELSRIEFVLRSIQSKSQLRQSHTIGIKLNFDKYDFKRHAHALMVSGSLIDVENTHRLTDEDCELLSFRLSDIYQKLSYMSTDSNDFYKANNIQFDSDQVNEEIQISSPERYLKGSFPEHSLR